MLTIQLFCEEYNFCFDAASYFSAQYQKLKTNAEAYSIFCAQLQAYKDDRAFDHLPALEKLHTLAEAIGIHKYTMEMLYILCLLPDLKIHYQCEGIPLQYFGSFTNNLKAYAESCHKTYGVWGTNIAWWLMDFFKLKLFSIGRLQFRRRKFRKNTGPYTQGTYYIDIHIPGGAPLTSELCAASYAEAADFFRQRYGMEKILFGCHSWIISPEIKAILPEKSNILAFGRHYTVYETHMDPNSSAVSFIFNIPGVPADLDSLPEATSLQKAIKQHLKAGKTINTAFGIMDYEKCKEELR